VDITLQDPLVGRVVDDRYLIEARIARGGMATVYRALDRRLDREVALKVMHDDLAVDEAFVSRFVREARAAARLSNPNVVQVFDQGSDGPVLYLAMEYLPGRTLRDVLTQRGALTARESVSVLEPVLNALGAAHRAGIVHRDVKPENVILTDDGRIKVADFGLAGAKSGPITRTANGELLGTVAYLSPELVSRGIADTRADVYAAGIMLFELLSGKQPFTGDEPVQVAYRHVHEQVPAPSSVSPGLPTAFDDVVARATDHDPDRRPADANALLAEVRQALALMPAAELDQRTPEAAALRAEADSTQVHTSIGDELIPGAPAPAAAAQPTRALAVTRRSARQGGGGAPIVPRLKVHDDEPAPPGFLGDRNRQAVAAIIAVAVVVLMIFTGVWWFTGGPGSYTKTPALVGEPEADARRQLLLRGLTPVVKKVFSDDVAAGQVVSTDPSGGGNVKKNGTVVLQVSKGPQLVVVPPLKGKTQDSATSTLQDLDLGVGDVKRKFSNSVDQGDVISSSPSSGTKIAPGRKVNLVISKGKEPAKLDNVVGQNVDAARSLLNSHGFKVVVQDQDFQEGGPGPGTVVAQDPAATQQDQTAPKGSTVTLTVIKGIPGQIVVPDVTGRNFDEVKAELEGLGLRVRRVGFPFANTVRGQNINGPAQAGQEITLWVGQ
jgi:serine/threonine-protein kinase